MTSKEWQLIADAVANDNGYFSLSFYKGEFQASMIQGSGDKDSPFAGNQAIGLNASAELAIEAMIKQMTETK